MLSAYDIWAKTEHIRQAQSDFNRLYGKHVTPFNRKQYFYFIADGGRKYVHKPSLQYVYTNRDTFTHDEGLEYCHLTKEFTPIDIINILETQQLPFMPKLIDVNDSFLVYEYVEGEPMHTVSSHTYNECKRIHLSSPLTPFYNSVNDNLLLTDDGITLIDFKQLDPIDPAQPFYVYVRAPHYTELHVDVDVCTDDIVQLLDEEFSTLNLSIIRHQ